MLAAGRGNSGRVPDMWPGIGHRPGRPPAGTRTPGRARGGGHPETAPALVATTASSARETRMPGTEVAALASRASRWWKLASGRSRAQHAEARVALGPHHRAHSDLAHLGGHRGPAYRHRVL